MYDPRLSDEENAALKSAYEEYKWSDKYYAQRCRDNRNVMSGMWKVLGCIALGCIAFGAAIGAAPGGFVLAAMPLLFGLFISLICAIFPEDWTGIF